VVVEEGAEGGEALRHAERAELAVAVAEPAVALPRVGVEEHPPDAVVELPLEAVLLVGDLPAVGGVGHAVVGGGEGEIVEAPVAEIGGSVAFARGGFFSGAGGQGGQGEQGEQGEQGGEGEHAGCVACAIGTG